MCTVLFVGGSVTGGAVWKVTIPVCGLYAHPEVSLTPSTYTLVTLVANIGKRYCPTPFSALYQTVFLGCSRFSGW